MFLLILLVLNAMFVEPRAVGFSLGRTKEFPGSFFVERVEPFLVTVIVSDVNLSVVDIESVNDSVIRLPSIPVHFNSSSNIISLEDHLFSLLRRGHSLFIPWCHNI
ncbi:hypothetical protein TrST_g13701 [Triparma strigata]|uniref:Secreted protein n=1 Tax=Triparma strigata TaxID=1606541 RepID=A0A9W7BUM6_9STRA|nr:hypothetical protein TrST_g13701 [Triparma strigata]